MTDENGIDPDLLQPEDTVKPKRVRKTKTEKTEKPAVEAKEETGQQYTYTHPEYDMYKAYQKQFEEQQKQVLEFWTAVMRNIWNPWK